MVQDAVDLAVALRIALRNRDIEDVVVLTAQDAEELYQIVLNWGLALPHYRHEAALAIQMLGFEPPEEWWRT